MPLNSVCGNIQNSLLLNCASPIVPGITDFIYLFNRADAQITRSNVDPNIVTGITMNAGTSGHAIQGINNIFSASHKLVELDAGPRYEHEIKFRALTNSASVKAILQNLAFGRVFCIVENLYQGGDATFEIYGLGAGLVLTANTRDTNDANGSGSFNLILTKPKNVQEPNMPASFQVPPTGSTTILYDYNATKTALLALIPAPVGTSSVTETAII